MDSPGIPVSTTNKTDCHDIIEILLNTITLNRLPLVQKVQGFDLSSECHYGGRGSGLNLKHFSGLHKVGHQGRPGIIFKKF